MKGNKLVIAVILALIVCLVLIPTCAFADNDGAVVDNLAYTAENPDNAGGDDLPGTPGGGDNPSGAPDGGNGNGAGSGSGDANQSGNVSESGNDGSSDAGTEGGTEGGAENGDDSNKGEGEKQPEPGDEEEGKLPDSGEEENESEENEDSEQFNAVKSAPAPVQQTTPLWTSDSGDGYNSLQDAVDNGGDSVKLTLNRDGAGDGLIVNGKTVTIDFGGYTYNVNGKLVGSSGTESQGMQILKGSNVTLMNGTFTSNKAKMLIQNYGDLTLIDMNIDGTQSDDCSYVVSNNNGSFTVLGSSGITANEGETAFDLYYWPSGSYKDGVTVTINTTGTITGRIEYEYDGTTTTSKNLLNISSGTLNGKIYVNGALKNDAVMNDKITPTGGVYTDESIIDYVGNDALVVKSNGKIGVNGSSVDILNDALANDGTIEIVKVPENGLTIDGIPAGVKVINNSNGKLVINGVEIEPEVEYTVPAVESKTATPIAATASAPLYAKYLVLEGRGQQWTDGDLELVLNSNAVVKVLIDGVEVEFTVAEDGTVTIASAVIEALEAGTHEIQFIFADGSCMTTFTK